MALTDNAIKAAKPLEKPYKMADEKGLFLLLNPNGRRYWRLKYRFSGKEQLLAIGVYPDVSLKEARLKRDEARKQIQDGINPNETKKAEKHQAILDMTNSFEAIAREWIEMSRNKWSVKHCQQTLTSLEQDIFPAFGHKTINSIKPLEVLQALRRIEERGAIEIAKRVRQRCEAVFRYAIITEKAEHNPVSDLQGALTAPNPQNYPALSSQELPEFLAAFAAYPCEEQTRIAFNLLMLTGVRTGELIGAKWTEFDFEVKEWRVPAERMKRKQEHIVPLSRQALALIEEMRALSGHFVLVFPHRSEPLKAMCNATFLRVIERLGYKGRMTGHGLRSAFSSILNESNLWNSDAIERQLAHVPASKVRGAYLRAQFLPERHKMMQWYADYLEQLQGKNVIHADFGQQKPA
ncbi:tyrosine-type recombinase/integrase [Moraxellaceae bacterium AER2_44_116]|nr:tyrosine-type recombinase/integrase [Moraxellaceae bacterium]TQC97180.1 tyrosine-type recombinase/integrase [Moraxellaceae bacterium AER2_44_116]